MFPANGHFSPGQRELYGTYVKLYSALMAGIRPGASPSAIISQVVPVMDRIVSSTTFSRASYRAAAERFVDGFRHNTRNRLGHFVGMEVHDVSTDFDALTPGMVFTIEPQLVVPEERIYIRLEDVIVVTPDGYENLSSFVPIDIEGVEKTMSETGRFESGRLQSSVRR
jgi:Xaa-Pro aminopeptidase